jgi:signal transduction histidine kinase/CheY-like chemotaxis protein
MNVKDQSSPLRPEDELRIYRECFRAIPFPVMIFDESGGLVDISDTLKSLTDRLGFVFRRGVSFDEGMAQLRAAYGNSASADTLRNWHDGEAAARTAALEGAVPVEFERFDGGWRLINVIRTKSGFTLDLRTDITEQKRKQADLAAAEARAQAADRAKSQFLANMSHEIRTPMNGVMGMAELLCATSLTTKQKNFADIILQSSEALLRIINDILDFSKIEAGEMELRPEPFDLVEAVEDVALLVSAKAASKKLELAVRFNPALPSMLIGDASRIRQVVTNLMSNAVKFTEKGHVLVDIDGETGDLNGAKVARLMIRVEDSGLGIPDDKLTSIFEKFTQVDNSATRTYEGTGLGLSICKSLIELMGGEIGVTSAVGKGSTFWFRIELPAHKASARPAAAPLDVTGARLLIIDDNAVNRSILLEQANAWRFRPKATVSGEVGIELLKAAVSVDAPFDAVILDYQMPTMTGAETAARIRADAAIRDTPIIMLTSIDHKDVGAELSTLNIQGHLIKPAKASLLLEEIVSAIQANRDRAAGAGDCPEPAPAAAPAEIIMPAAGERRVLFELDSNPAKGLDLVIAEDNEVNKIVYRQILDSYDWTYEVASDGREALELIERRRPRLVIMDVSMPIMNGLEAATALRLRENETGAARTPIIGVTAHAMSGDMEKCLDAGMDDYLSKPISPKRIVEKVQKWLNGAGAAKAIAS